MLHAPNVQVAMAILTLVFPPGTVATVVKVRGRWVVQSVNTTTIQLTINDFDNDGFISNDEWDPVAGGGGGNDRGQTNYLYGGTGSSGTLYNVSGGTFTVGQNVNGVVNSLSNNFEANISAVTCFASGTMITTARGDVPVEDIVAGDRVLTADHGLQAVRWVGARHLSASDLAANSKLRPVRIMAGALGVGRPVRDLLVSRQHRILLASVIAERMFGTREVLVPAIRLTDLPGIFVDTDCREVRYHHLLFDRHEVVLSEGAWSESLFTGPQALQSLSAAARAEILTLFPELENMREPLRTARPVPRGKAARRLMARHRKNGVALFF